MRVNNAMFYHLVPKNGLYQVEVGTFVNVARTLHNEANSNYVSIVEKGGSFLKQISNLKIIPVETKLFCKECENCFDSNIILRRHIESVHKGIVYNCTTCNKLFKSLAAMTRHSKTHKESAKKHECDICKK